MKTNVLTPERKALLDQCVEDGWPLIQMRKTHGFCHTTVKRHYPEYRGMDNREAAKLGAAARRTTLALRKARR